MNKLNPLILWATLYILCSIAWADDIPQLINFQGVLDSAGIHLADRTVSVEFKIYDDSTNGNVLWSETQSVTTNASGLFNVLLGSSNPIPDTAFLGTSRYLGIKITTEASEMTPRQRLVSMPYVYEFDETGPDSVVSSYGTAFLGKVSGSSASSLYGIRGSASNTSTGPAYGGYFTTSSSGTGDRYGVVCLGFGSSSLPTYGSYGLASNSSTGTAYGGYYTTSSSGSGEHYGVYADAFGSAAGRSYGGRFIATSDGAGEHYGVHCRADGSSSSTYGSYALAYSTSIGTSYGSYGFASNTSVSSAIGGYFWAASSGTGTHIGVYGVEAAGGSGAAVYAGGDMIASGAKPAVVKTAQGHRLLYAMESPEVWFEDFGEGQLSNGQAHVELDALFLETVTINGSNPMKVFIQLTSGNPVNVVVNKGTTGFDVMVSDNASAASFDYRIIAKRRGYETQRLMQTDVGMDDPNLYPELWEKIGKERQERQSEMEKSRIQN